MYNLSVPGPENYVLANGVVVHNCYDEVAYVMASRPHVTSARRRADIDYLAAVREAGIVNPRGRGRYVTR